MPVNIREAFLQDAEQSCFHFSIQSCHVRWNFQIDLNPAALGKSFTVPASGGGESGFIQQRWVKEVRDGASLGEAFFHRIQAIGK